MHANVHRYEAFTWGPSHAKMRGVVCGLWAYSGRGSWSMIGCDSPRSGPKIKHERDTWSWNARNVETWRVGRGGYTLREWAGVVTPHNFFISRVTGSGCLVPWGSRDMLPCTCLVGA